jgi:hypothetical protein
MPHSAHRPGTAPPQQPLSSRRRPSTLWTDSTELRSAAGDRRAARWCCNYKVPGMAKLPPEPPQLPSWNIYKVTAKARPLGTVEAASPNEAIEKAAAQFKVPASKLIAVSRR